MLKSLDVCDPESFFFDQEFCDYKSGVLLDDAIVNPCDPENVGHNYCRCNPGECDTNDPCDILSSAYDVDICNGSNSGGSGGGGSAAPTPLEIAHIVVSNALATGLAFKKLYVDLGTAVFNGTPINTNTLVKNILDTSLTTTFKEQLRLAGQLDGVAILGVTGKVLGISGTYMSANKLVEEYLNTGSFSMINVVDLGINVGLLFIKSNIVGLGISAGWLLIKGDFGE